MKKIITVLLSMLFILQASYSQTAAAGAVNMFKPGSELLIKGGIGFVKGGMPGPFSFTITRPAGAPVSGLISYPTSKPGLNAGVDYNYYFNRNLGGSVTFDYFSNAYKKITPPAPFNSANITYTQKNQVNKFAGLGIIGRTGITNKMTVSAALYGGMLWHTKNNYQADYTIGSGSTTILKFSSNKPLSAIAAKGSVRVAYAVTPRIAVSAGAEYIIPFFSTKQYQSGLLPGSSAGYFVNPPRAPGVTLPPQGNFDSSYVKTTGFYLKQEPLETQKLRLLAINLAVKFTLGGKVKKEKKVKTAKTQPECCGTCPVYGLAVTARDKYTKEVLPNTDVAIKNPAGEIVKTGTTNAFGIIVFDKIVKEDYTISALLNNVALENSSIKATELICDKVIQKEVLYGDRNFIIKGKAVVCNTTTPIAGINVTLENKELAFKRSTMTDAEGTFILQLPETGTYQLYGRKESYFSQIEEVSSSDYNREKTLFVKLEICAEKADCGKAINLKNILFDLDKYVIKEEAKKELNKLVQFMKDNPGVRVEVGSHTDCRASAEYNQTLSQNRANASVDYIVSQGISRDRISGKGYGESQLLNRCADGVNCTEAEHAINRRTEMKVICPDNK